MLRHNVPVRRDLDQIAADNGFDFHIIDNEIYWDESRAYRFTLRQIEEQIEKPTAELHQMCLEVVDRAVKDEEILTAITYHTTGRPGMSLLEKIVYISDYIEPMRDKAPNLPKVRKIAFEDLDECMYEILKDTLEYLEENPKEIDSTTRDAYVYYKDLHDRKMQDAANRQED